MQRDDVDLTVVIPCRNEVETLADQLEALSTQTCDADWEVCVVDNGSTDGSQQLVRARAERWKRLRLIEAHDRAGVGYARNAGVHASSATHVAFCDGDDIVEPNWVAAMWAQLEQTDLASGVLEPTLLNPPRVALSRGGAEIAEPRFMGIPIVAGCNGGFRRDVWESLGGYDENYDGLEDIEFSLRAIAAGYSIGITIDAIVHYRYRTELRSVWRQGIFYGRSYPRLCRQASELGVASVPRLARWKTWATPIVRLPWLRTSDGRAAWVWSLANRVGTARGVLEFRAFWI